MCNCLDRMEQKVLEFAKGKKEFEGKEITVFCNEVLFDSKGAALSNTFRYEAEHTTKTGKTRKIKNDISIIHSYCPWCGEKIER